MQYLLVHLKKDGSTHWAGIEEAKVPYGLLEPGELAVVLHPLDVQTRPPEEAPEETE